MTNEQKYILQLTNKFVEQKGKGSCYAFKPIKPENIIFSFINLHRQKRTDTTILIVVRNYDERLKIKSLLEDNNLLDKITILSRSYMKTNYNYHYTFTFIIGQDDFDFLNHLTNQSKFTFAIFTELITDGAINNILPIIKPNITFNDLCKDRLNYPVEETHIPITMSDENKLEYYKYSEYINTSMSIFGSFENADKCRIGDMVLNISAGEFRYNLAKENGWSETLDTSIEFNKNIDDIYNPNSLFERANTLYNIIRERINLVTDNISKIPAIIDIINKYPNKKILIVNKRGEFANIIANYINDNTEYLCGEYHDCIPEQYIKDENGEYITYKSGENKGKRKLFKSQSLSTMCLNRFNSKDKSLAINLLSIKNSSDIKLKTAIDIVIFTSSVCHSPNEFINRFSNIEFTTKPLISYMIYCDNTIESNKISERVITNNVKLTEQEKNIQIDEKNGAIYLQ